MATLKSTYRNSIGFFLLSLGTLAGITACGYVLIVGHTHAYNLTRQIPWGILISTYVFFAVSCSGLCLVSSLGHVFGIKHFELIGKRAIMVAIIMLLTGFGVIAMELDHPFRMILWVVLTPNFSSAIWWMGTLYGLYLVVLCIELYAFMTDRHKLASTAGLVGFLTAIAACSNLGSVFGLLDARPFWHGPYLPIFFILSAFVSGTALLALIIYFNHHLRGLDFSPQYERLMDLVGKLHALFLGLLLFFLIWKSIVGIYMHFPGIREATMAMLSGNLSINFWMFEVGIGILLPLFLLLNKTTRTPKGIMFAGLLTMIGIFFMRYNMVIAGQLVPMRVPEFLGTDTLFHYAPSLAETGIVIGALSVSLLLYILVEIYFDLNPLEGRSKDFA